MEEGEAKRHIYPRHPPINDKIRPVHEPALVAREEKHRLRLLDRFAEAAGREMDFAAVALGRVVAEEVLEEGGAVCQTTTSAPYTGILFIRLSPRRRGGKMSKNGWERGEKVRGNHTSTGPGKAR